MLLSQSSKFGDGKESKTSSREKHDFPAVKVPRSAGPRTSITGMDMFMLPDHNPNSRRRSSVLTEELAAFKMSVRPEPRSLLSSLPIPVSPGQGKRKSISDTSLSQPTPLPSAMLLPNSTVTPAPSQMAPQQYVLEKPPRLMKMTLGDHYMIPHSVSSLRFDVCFSMRPEVGDVDVDINAISFAQTGKKIDHCSMTKRTSKDKSLQHLGDDQIPGGYSEHGESLVVNLALVNPEATVIFITLSVSSPGRFVTDFEKLHVRCVEIGLYPGSPELFRYQYQPNRIKQTGVAFFALTRETITRSPTAQPVAPAAPASAGGKKKAAPPVELIHLWTAKAVGVELIQRSLKLVALDCEDATRRLGTGWLPIPKGLFQVGGDMSRFVSDRMTKKALKRQGADENSVSRSGAGSTDSEESDSRDSKSKHTGRDSVDTATPIDQGQLEFESLFAGGASKNGQGRPRVVRRNKRVYSVGQAVKATEKHHPSSDEEGSDDEDDLFRQVFRDYASRRVVRYDDKCYNVGTYKEQLLQHYLVHKDQYDVTVKHFGDVFSKAPLVVDCVVDEEEDLANLICPSMELDPLHEMMDTTTIAEYNNAHSVIKVAELPAATSPHSADLEASAPAAAPGPPEQQPEEQPSLPVPQSPSAGRLLTARPPPTCSPYGACLPSGQVSPAAGNIHQQLRFGKLKPPPPFEMQQMRQIAEQKKLEEEAALQKSMNRDSNASTSKTARRKSRSSVTADMLIRRGTTEMMKISTQPQKLLRPTDILAQMMGQKVTSKKKPQLFSGELQSWIEAHQRKEQERKVTYGRTGRASLSPNDPLRLPTHEQQTGEHHFPVAQSSPSQLSDSNQKGQESHAPHPPGGAPPTVSPTTQRLSGDPVLLSENRRPSAAPPGSREGRRTSVQFQFDSTVHPSVSSDRSDNNPSPLDRADSPNVPEMRQVSTRKSLKNHD
jgi:hypothetical protein